MSLVLSGIRFNIDCSKDKIEVGYSSELKKQIEDPAASIMVLSRGLERNSTEMYGYTYRYCITGAPSRGPGFYLMY